MTLTYSCKAHPAQYQQIMARMPRLMEKFFFKQVVATSTLDLLAAGKRAETAYKVHPDIPSVQSCKSNITATKDITISIGAIMEQTLIELEDVNAEVLKSKQLLQETMDDITAIRQLVAPELSKYIQDLRSNRSAVEREIKSMLSDMREMRKFFTDPKLVADMATMREFVTVIYNLKNLSDNNMLNAMINTMLQLKSTSDTDI